MSVLKVDEGDFDAKVMKSNNLVLVDFWAPWCGPCRAVGPILEELAVKKTSISVAKINVDENPNLAVKYKISSIPNMKLFKDGREVSSKVGALNLAQLVSWVEEFE